MKRNTLIFSVASVMVGGSAMAASAYNFNVYDNSSAYSVAGAQGGFMVMGDDSAVTFNFGNLMGFGSLTNFYFEDGLSAYLSTPSLDFAGAGPLGKNFTVAQPGGNPVNAAGLNWAGSFVEIASSEESTGLGVESDRLSVSFALSGIGFDDFTALLDDEGFRVATAGTVGGVASIFGTTNMVSVGDSAVGPVNAVPTPTAALAGAAMLGLAAVRRRRAA